MAEGHDGRQFIPVLRRYLKDGSKVLELGMGPGKDFELLSEYFQITGSDNSQVFIDRFFQQPSFSRSDARWLPDRNLRGR